MPDLEYFERKLAPPPREGSFRDRMDLRDAIAQQQLVTEEKNKRIQRTYRFDVFYFSKVFGPDFNAEKYPKTAAFFAKVARTAGGVVSELKEHYKRLRPFAAHSDQIKLLVRNEPGYSYPSGHTARSRLSALIIAELDPPARRAVLNASEDVAVDRIYAGEHYLTDLEGGRSLGKILFQLLSKDPAFIAELRALKEAEWTPPPPIVAPAEGKQP